MATADELLCGRVTYEGFIQAWPGRSGDHYTDKINAIPKKVATRTVKPADMTWNASVLEGDLAAGVSAMKAQSGEDILKFGTGLVDLTLIPERLVDELHVWVFPVAAGGGERLLDGMPLTHLTLSETTRFGSGIVVLVYTPKWLPRGRHRLRAWTAARPS